jgi:hypothetical protein
MADEDYYVKLLNNYLVYYKKYNLPNAEKSNQTLFDGIDTDDKKSTNKQLEEFYQIICKFREYDATMPEMNELYEFGSKLPDKINKEHDFYGLMIDKKVEWISPSLFAVLIEYTNMVSDNPKLSESIHIVNL